MISQNKLIKALIILGINIFLILFIFQCSKQEKENIKIFYHKEISFYSFIVETPQSIFYSTPNNFELRSNTISNKESLIFEDELKKFKPYQLPVKEEKFDTIYVSNVLSESNFANNHLFEYDIKIAASGKADVNIYYPDDYKGSYFLSVDKETIYLLKRILNPIAKKKGAAINPKYNNSVLIISNQQKSNIYGNRDSEDKYPEYCLTLSLINKQLLEQINIKSNKTNKFNIKSEQYIHRILPPANMPH